MVNVPVLLTPDDLGTVNELPYFELYAVAPVPNTEITFEISLAETSDLDWVNQRVFSPGDIGWNKTGYTSGEIAVLSLTTELLGGVDLGNDKSYKWRARTIFNGVEYSSYSELKTFHTLEWRGTSTPATFLVDTVEKVISAMTPQLLSVDGIENTDSSITAITTSRIPQLVWSVPYGLGEGIHFRVEIDVVDTFDSRNILRYETKYNPNPFEIYDGKLWHNFPETGTVFGTEKARLSLQDTFFNDTYYWRVIPAI